ncbi:MAG TPA: 3-hydroxybutyrate oligomer hydrolase family protein [Luteimonas sp.]|nr:3-hydroxybutyrate oligomer hydrolase family protein [Luteimonas sp.]
MQIPRCLARPASGPVATRPCAGPGARHATTLLAAVLATGACAGQMERTTRMEDGSFAPMRQTAHRGDDDLLSAGLGLAGLRAMVPPAFADPARPTAGEARRRAIWSNWRGIADLAPGGGFGEVFGRADAVPGREFSALATVRGARHPHRVLVQVPDAFDATRRCVVVAASSGSRGVYGAIAVAAPWALPRGCAVAYTDKGAGTDYVDLDAGVGIGDDGTPAALGEATRAFAPERAAGATGVAFKHAHSQDNPEADWGRHVRQAAQFALTALDEAYPAAAPFTAANTRIIAVGISNGGGAVLRAAEHDDGLIDAVVAAEPNVLATGHGARALYDYTTEAAVFMPCALLSLDTLPEPPSAALATPAWTARCAALKDAGLVDGPDTAAQSRSALARLRAAGWRDEALRAGALSVGFDLWRAVAVTYASAYARAPAGRHPCGFGFAAQDARFAPRASTAAERAAWWSDASGIPPGAGVGILDPQASGTDPTIAGARCLRALWDGGDPASTGVRAAVEDTRAGLPREGLPVMVIHGSDDGLVPMAFSSEPYVAAARAAGRDVHFWQVRNAQHFDAFLGLPGYGARYVPLLPYVHAALDRVDAHLDGKAAMPADAVVETRPRGAGQPLTRGHLAIPL